MIHKVTVPFPLILLVASMARTQPTTGDVVIAGTGAQCSAIRFDRSGPVTTAHIALLSTNLIGRIPGNTLRFPYLRNLVIDHDNRSVVGAVYDLPTSWLVRFNPVTGSQITTLTHFPAPSQSVFYPYDVERHQDGGYILIGPKDQLWNVNAQGFVQTTLNLKTALPSFPTAYDYLLDFRDGHALLFYANNLFKLDRITGAVVSMYVSAINHGTTYQMSQDYRTGRILWGTGDGTLPSNCRGVMAVDLQSANPSPTTLLGSPNCPIKDFHYAYGSRLDRQSAANPLLLFAGFGAWAGLGSVDLSVATPQVQIHHFLNGQFSAYSLDVVGSVNVTSRLMKADRWELLLSFPGYGGKAYLLALGLSGTHPGISIQQRSVNLRPDSLTFVSIQGLLAPYLVGNIGTLDGKGTGRAILDLSALKGAMLGRPIYMVGLVLDPQAPGGVGVISDPYLILPGAVL